MTAGEEVPMRARMTLILWKDGGAVATIARVHQKPHGHYRLDYEAPPAAHGRVVCFDGSSHWQYEPRRRVVTRTTVRARNDATRKASLSLIERNYRIVLVSDHERQAGRMCDLIKLVPRQAGKGYQLRWVDRKSKKTLRTEARLADGSVARMVSYQQVTYPRTIPDSEFEPPVGPGTRVVRVLPAPPSPTSQDLAAQARTVGMPANGPLGFSLERVSTERVGGKRLAHLLYTDGLEAVSVFVQAGGGPPVTVPPGWHRMQADGASVYETSGRHVEAITWVRGKRRYTAVSHQGGPVLQAFIGVSRR